MPIFGVFRPWEHLVMLGFWLFTLKMTGKHLQKWFKILNRIRNFEISSLEINRWTHNWISDLSGLLDYLLKKFSQRPQSSWCAKCPVGLRYKTKFQILNRLIVWAGKKRHSENLHFIDEQIAECGLPYAREHFRHHFVWVAFLQNLSVTNNISGSSIRSKIIFPLNPHWNYLKIWTFRAKYCCSGNHDFQPQIIGQQIAY